ncbi:MAG TPA: CopD family protein [Kofleriaceae bacterium]|nr:CopD family protein [Kofleriaceae bacterium]
MTLDNLFLSFHVVGVLIWVGGLFALMAFLEAVAAEPDQAARGRLVKFLRQAAIVPDIGATIAILFGLHRLFKFKIYEAHYMHAKLALVVVLIGLHGYLKVKAKRARKGEAFTPAPLAMKPLLTVIVTAIIVFVIAKWPL